MGDAPTRDYAAELRVMPTSRLLILMAWETDAEIWCGWTRAASYRAQPPTQQERDQLRMARQAIKAEIDRRFPLDPVIEGESL